jgi:hypothetical protein
MVFADPASHRHATEELLELMEMEKVFSESINEMIDLQLRQSPELARFREAFEEYFERYMSWRSLEEDFVALFMQELTEEELRELTTFYRTPIGQKALKLPDLVTRGAEIGARKAQENKAELEAMLTERAKAPPPEAGEDGAPEK